MAYITDKKTIFFVTSPRTPFKMLDEIKILVSNFSGEKWNKVTQVAFAQKLSQSKFFKGKIRNNLDFAARDRINRAPKALGFIDLTPQISLTDAGKQLLTNKRPEEIFLRQLLKFQLPSPYHIDKNNTFNVKPYLELIRLVVDLKGLSKDEIAIFAMQLTNINNYTSIVNKINEFRSKVKSINRKKTSYKRTVREVYKEELTKIYHSEISVGNTGTRESRDDSLEKFIETKSRNFKDYADAAIRYLRSTQLVTFEYKANKLLASEYKLIEIDFILKNIDRNAIQFTSEKKFKNYLFNDNTPQLLSDDIGGLLAELSSLGLSTEQLSKIKTLTTEQIKDRRDELLEKTKDENVKKQVQNLQTYSEYEDITKTYEEIYQHRIVDPSLVFEWNTWRAFAMLDDGVIEGNFRFDIQGIPLQTAPGNKPDIECVYNNYDIIVEVTLSTGQKQFEMEGEPVARHLSQHQKNKNKETYCIFIAQKLNPATLAYFYSLHKTDIAFYGGKTKVIPLEVKDFQKILDHSHNSSTKPTSKDIYKFVTTATTLAQKSKNEIDWYRSITQLTNDWNIS